MEKVNYGIICALKLEAEGIISHIENCKSTNLFGIMYNFGTIGKKKVVVSICGMGKVNAAICAQTMIMTFTPDVIINVGVGGALDSTLKLGDIVISDRLVQHDVDTSYLGDPIGYISGTDKTFFDADKTVRDRLEKAIKELNYSYRIGTIASGDQFISSKEAKDRIVKNFGGIVAEMEGAAVAHVCYVANVKFCILRSISDGADENSNMDFFSFTKMAADKSTNVILKLLK
ncbi:MAG: 5'-methylthioadenosine/adenosylhomocysteine nucleosidase [Clostridiales bacterium]|nr:5'-methylthioadenosine/adenosylhomocysteine nucleosidase [Clostridiales bacterium]